MYPSGFNRHANLYSQGKKTEKSSTFIPGKAVVTDFKSLEPTPAVLLQARQQIIDIGRLNPGIFLDYPSIFKDGIANLGMIFPELAQNKARAEEQKAERQKGKAKEKWKGAQAKRKAAWKAYLEAEGSKANRSTKSRYEKACEEEDEHRQQYRRVRREYKRARKAYNEEKRARERRDSE